MTTQRWAALSAVLVVAGLLVAAWGGLAGLLVTVTLVALLALYLLPSIAADQLDHQHRVAIVALNLLLGWTLLGWVVALVWAVMDQPAGLRRPQNNPASGGPR
ncbi:MAG: superinfection immunity protein [Proteobacteria bacterium]|nr:superinfection immunity protein [Pseudomonadota bacterium]